MPRIGRVQSGTGIYHVMLRGINRQGIVNDDVSDPYHTYDTMDDYVVEYNGNQKRSVNGTGGGNPSYFGSSSFVDGMPEGDNEYAYNANGAMTKDLNKGINDITYDLLGNLREITMSDNRSIRYVYAADGTRLRTTHKRKVGNTYLRDSTEYLGNLIVKNGQPVMYRFSGGYFAFDNGALSDCHYYIQDYLGNNRMVVSKGGSVKQSNHYYPYGGIIGGIDFNPTLQPYKFEDKELDRTYGLDWYDIHARQYDPVVPSWHTIDPLAEKYYYISPYAYCLNNPVNYVDLRGDSIIVEEENREQILSLINGLSEGEFDVNDNGFLFMKSDLKYDNSAIKYSKYYRDQLVLGINSDNNIYIAINKGIVNFMNREVKVLDYGGGVTIFPDNGNAYIYISGESVEKSYDNPPKIILAHELAGHAIPAVVNPSEYDKRFDGLAVTAENIIRSEVGMGLRPMDS